MRNRSQIEALVVLGGLLAGCRIVPDSQAPVTPQRPTFSSDTNTVPEGMVELEAGVILDPGDLVATPTTLKYGVGPAAEVSVGWSPLNYLSLPGEDEFGIGDVFLGLRHRFREEGEDRPSLAVQSVVKLPTADDGDGLGTGELDAFFAGIASKAVGKLSLTGFYQFEILGDPAGGTDIGNSFAFAAGQALGEGIGAFAEVVFRFVPENDLDQYFTTLGATYAVSPALVLDVAVLLGLDDAPDFQLLVGFTHNFGRLAAR